MQSSECLTIANTPVLSHVSISMDNSFTTETEVEEIDLDTLLGLKREDYTTE